jgi:hypothetical protein
MPKIQPTTQEGANSAELDTRMQQYYEEEVLAKRHNCTDVLCLIIFGVFFVCQVALSLIIYFSAGDPRSFLLPHDSNGNICANSQPYLFYFNLIECINVNTLLSGCSTPAICVAYCPPQNYYYLIDAHRSALFKNYCDQIKLTAYFKANVPTSLVDTNTYLDLVNKKICPVYALQSSSVYERCLPSFLNDAINATQAVLATNPNNNQTLQINDLTQDLNYGLVSKAIQYVVNLMNIKTFSKFS